MFIWMGGRKGTLPLSYLPYQHPVPFCCDYPCLQPISTACHLFDILYCHTRKQGIPGQEHRGTTGRNGADRSIPREAHQDAKVYSKKPILCPIFLKKHEAGLIEGSLKPPFSRSSNTEESLTKTSYRYSVKSVASSLCKLQMYHNMYLEYKSLESRQAMTAAVSNVPFYSGEAEERAVLFFKTFFCFFSND